jgi:DNA mismatch repair protein MutS
MKQSEQTSRYTPMMQQYLEIKEDYADAIVFFRLGDFYEMFFDDAILASKILEIALTSRDAGQKVPMCGVPYHAAKAYIRKLIDKGMKVAIAEQVTEAGKGLVKREVIRLITPGTVLEEDILDAGKNNHIASVILTERGYVVSVADISTGESQSAQDLDKRQVKDLVESLDIREIVVMPNFDPDTVSAMRDAGRSVSTSDDYTQVEGKALAGLSTEQKRGASHLINYINDTQKQPFSHLMPFRTIEAEERMRVDVRVKKHLEVFESLSQNKSTTLMHWLNNTRTAMGSRRMIAMFNAPLTDKAMLETRYDTVETFMPHGPRAELASALKSMYDINRIIGRVAYRTANARDLKQLKETLGSVPAVKNALMAFGSQLATTLSRALDPHDGLTDFLERSIHEDPPITLKEGGLIKEGYDQRLDELNDIESGGASWLSDYEAKERARTGIKNLKVGYNRVFGYYIDITRGNTALVKDAFGYERKQTLRNSERYITDELKAKEEDLLHARDKKIALEYDLFKDIREEVFRHTFSLQDLSGRLADIDVFMTLAEYAVNNRLVRPSISSDRSVKVIKGRHPVVEKFTDFVANDVIMAKGEIFLITGPNMSGKSTYMRMYALIVLMAQTGSFVPADSASLPLYDALFTRIGSSDDIAGGKSTFMVEMVESNEALTRATENSLILFDEIGRGTATYDGMALAQGIVEYIHQKIKAQTLFSTHYHELTALENSLERLSNLSVKAKEEHDTMVFLHHVERGASDKSYGIQVASLAHLPKSLVERSKAILKALENKEDKVALDLFNYDTFEDDSADVIDADHVAILDEIGSADIDRMTPIDALLLLRHYQSILKRKP